ncbi:MAG TPA: thioesterase family protein [Syntrophobacteria bacterium]|nr:thioesterase family protein [Syntrophobacteria bacterium]
MEGYRVVFEHEILFRDLDALGHVNNVAFIAFMEDARVKYWKALRRELDARRIDFILADVTCRYHSPAHFGEVLMVGIRVVGLGNKSFRFEYRMEDKATGRLVVEGRSVQVMYDYESQQSIPLDDATRGAMAAVEGVPLARLLDDAGATG